MFGRDYKTAKEVQEAWDAGKDFIIQCIGHRYNGRPMNNQDAQPGEQYNIRYNKKTDVHIIPAK